MYLLWDVCGKLWKMLKSFVPVELYCLSSSTGSFFVVWLVVVAGVVKLQTSFFCAALLNYNPTTTPFSQPASQHAVQYPGCILVH